MSEPKEQTKLFLVIVAGLPGTGKTTLAKALATHFGWNSFHKDEFKEQLWDGSQGQIDNENLGKQSIEMLLTKTQMQLAASESCIAEAPFRFLSDYQIIRQMAEQHEAKILSCICEVDEYERKIRVEQRKVHRHPAHHDNFTVNTQMIDWTQLPGTVVFLDMKQRLQDVITEVNSYLLKQ